MAFKLFFGYNTGPTLVFMRPDADSSNSGWTDQAGGSSNLYLTVDEIGASDADYVRSSVNPTSDVIRFRMSDPSSGLQGPFNVRYRYGVVGDSGSVPKITARLKQGTTLIKEWVHTDASATFQTVKQTLSSGELASITDFNDLFMEFEAGASSNPLVVSYTPGANRHDATGRVGMKFTITSNITYAEIGLRCGTGFTGNHTVYLFESPSTLLRSATIDMTGKTTGVFYYTGITPVALVGGTSYYLVTDITANDGQDWADLGATTLNNATGVLAAYSVTTPPYTTFTDFTANTQYFGVDMR
jgi:hypothetical protein